MSRCPNCGEDTLVTPVGIMKLKENGQMLAKGGYCTAPDCGIFIPENEL